MNSVAGADPAKRALVFVHGRDFKPARDEFMDLSMAALAAGLERDYPDCLAAFHALEKRLGWYGDITDDFLTRQGQRYDEALDLGDRRNALAKMRTYTRKKHFGVGRYDRLPGKTALPEFAADAVAPVLGKLGFSNMLLAKVGVDLVEYWNTDSDFAARIRKRVRDTICQTLDDGYEVMLICHGTGCIVTWDVLWQLSHDERYADRYGNHKIDIWLTAGAPLGDAMVQKRILGADRDGVARYPTNIVSWHNVSAEDDYVSHDNTLADDFKAMLDQKQVSCIRDYCVYNMAVRYGKSNPHSSLGYLIHPRVTQILTDWLQHEQLEALPELKI